MRCFMNRVVVVALVALFVASARADGPQFTGLMNFYNSSGPIFDETANSLARMDRDGIIPGTAIRLSVNYSDIVVAPDGSAYYAIVQSSNVFRINPVTLAATQMSVSGILVGETWDSSRNRLVV